LIRASRSLLFALLFVSFTSSIAAAQQKTDSQESQQPSRPQNANQIVGFSESQPAESAKASDVLKKIEAVLPQVVPPSLQAAVIPPPPNVVKLSANSISIPADKATADSKFEQKPIVASQATVGSVYGVRRDPFTRRARFHSGVDIKAHLGDPVGASQRGAVEFAGWYHGYGNLIIVGHGGGVRTHYAHLSSLDVEVGARVERGTIIGRAGSTGRATSPHLHYEVRVDGIALNPFQALALDPSSEYFKQTKSPADATGRDALLDATRPRRVN
jgi:murein DD-endopeptidase MepM/ murein hydrolase activator NlpD